jgi:alanine-glyoxylate transaminase/serine-glyoxylate transaminase/serine-pyruvate transaminase
MTSRASANSRLNLFSKHLDSKPFLELNTPFSTERTGHLEDAQGNRIQRNKPQEIKKVEPEQPKKGEPPKMSSNQAPHPALMIPGPIEFDDAVLQSMSYYR